MINKPKCVIVTGRPGSGKTTLAKEMGRRLWVPVVSRDEIKEGYVNTVGVPHDLLASDTNAIVFNLFFEIVHQYLAGRISIVIEAAFQHQVWAPRMPKILELGNPLVVICAVESEMAAKRHLQRGLDHPDREFYHGDKSVAIYRGTGVMTTPAAYETPNLNVPTVEVSTENGYSPGIDEIVDQIRVSTSVTT